MNNTTEQKTARLADEIVNEFKRLEVSTDDDPYSGLMTRVPDVVSDLHIVDIYDDYASGFYDAQHVLNHLIGLQPGETSLDSEDPNNIWQQIADFNV